MRKAHPDHRDGARLRLELRPREGPTPGEASAFDMPAAPRVAEAGAVDKVALEEAPPPEYAPPPLEGEIMPPAVPVVVPSDNYASLITFVVDSSIAFREGDLSLLGKPTKEQIKLVAKNIAQMQGKDADNKVVIAIIVAQVFVPVAYNFMIGIRRMLADRAEKKAKKEREEAEAASGNKGGNNEKAQPGSA